MVGGRAWPSAGTSELDEADSERVCSAATSHCRWALCRGSSMTMVLKLERVSEYVGLLIKKAASLI